jgi:acid stress chaperone HdeB
MKEPIPARLSLAVALVLTASSAAWAQVTLDVAKVTCGQFATYKITNPQFIAIWLNGYYHGVRGDTVVDTQKLDEDTKTIQDYCIKNPDALLMQAVGMILGPVN